MRPKAPFLRRGRVSPVPAAAKWEGEYAAPDDEQLPEWLRDVLTTWRNRYDDDRPSAQDVRAGLAYLARVSDGEALAAVRAVDAWTDAQLVTGALRLYRRKHPDGTDLDRVTNPQRWSPADIRAAAAEALNGALRTAGGRPRTSARDVGFMRVLLALWAERPVGLPPYPSFAIFAHDMFTRAAGRFLGERELRALKTAASRMG